MRPYEAAVTIMMRVVFLLFAEAESTFRRANYSEQKFTESLANWTAWQPKKPGSEGILDATSLTWHRLLYSQALPATLRSNRCRMPAYGGFVCSTRVGSRF